MKEHLTMQELEDMGFEIVKSHSYDKYITQIRAFGVLLVETSWLKTGEFHSQDLVIQSIDVELADVEWQKLHKLLK